MSKSNTGRIGVYGASGSGKSSYVKQRIKGRKRVIVFDPMEEYGGAGIATCKTVEQVRQAMVKDWKGFRISYVPPAGKEARAISQLCSLILVAQEQYKGRDSGDVLTLVVEEMNLAFPVHGGAEKAPKFAEVCSRGRHSFIEVIGASQRIAEVATRWRGNCTETVILRQNGAADTGAAVQSTGASANDVKALVNLEYLHEKQGSITHGKISFGKSKKTT